MTASEPLNLRVAFVGRVLTEDNQEPEASKARQLGKARSILPPGAEIVAEYFDIATAAHCPGPAALAPDTFSSAGPATAPP